MISKTTLALSYAALFALLPLSGLAATNPDAVTCNTVVACIFGQNTSASTSTDIGLEGISVYGYGLVGVTSSRGNNPVAGLYGKDQGTDYYSSGVLGLSTNGYGVNGVGRVGVFALGTGSAGVGLSAVSNAGSNGAAIFSTAYNGGTALFGAIDNGTGVNIDASQTNSILVSGGSPGGYFTIDGSGNILTTGTLTYIGSASQVQSEKGRDVATYDARASSPTLEDFGEATLSAGSVHISLESIYASTINTKSYMVFITPEGDSNGLYTTARTSSGFDVRENAAGHSTLAFAYRIVAKPLDSTGTRLQVVPRHLRLKTARARQLPQRS